MINEANKGVIVSLTRKIAKFMNGDLSIEEVQWTLETAAGLLERDSTALPGKIMDAVYELERIQALTAAAEQRPAAESLLNELLREFDAAIESS